MTLLSKRFPALSNIFDEPFFNADFNGNKSWMAAVPPVNVVDKKGEFEVEIAVPGMKKEDFQVTCENGYLTIKAEKEERKEEKEKTYTRREYNYNSFERSFLLPETVKNEQVKAKYENGVLKISIPKKEEARSKPKIEVKVA